MSTSFKTATGCVPCQEVLRSRAPRKEVCSSGALGRAHNSSTIDSSLCLLCTPLVTLCADHHAYLCFWIRAARCPSMGVVRTRSVQRSAMLPPSRASRHQYSHRTVNIVSPSFAVSDQLGRSRHAWHSNTPAASLYLRRLRRSCFLCLKDVFKGPGQHKTMKRFSQLSPQRSSEHASPPLPSCTPCPDARNARECKRAQGATM